MKTSFVSTPAFANALKLSMRQAQADLFTAQKELATSRYADVGLSLGVQTGLTVSLRQQFDQLSSIATTNALVGSRLDASQVALDGIAASADEFMQGLISARDASSGAPIVSGPAIVQGQAVDALEALIDGLNSTFGSGYLFAGIDVDQQPITDYFATPAPANKAAVDAAFLAEFGFTQNDPNVANITEAQMQDFLDNDFAPLFDEAQWVGVWSSASSVQIESRISTSEVIQTSASANEAAFRTLAEAYTMVADLGTADLNETAYKALIDTAIRKVGEAVEQLTGVRAQLGVSQDRLGLANERMALQSDILATQIVELENIDPYEASTRVSQLTSQVEVAYALTARMQRLGIMQFL